MNLQLIRNATLRMWYAGHLLVIDPYLADKHSLRSFTGKSQNPMVDLPCRPQEVIEGAEMVMVSHLHPDHFDAAAQELLPKDTPIFCQPGDEVTIAEQGFQSVSPIEVQTEWQGITISRTPCEHGSGHVLKLMGNASGFVFHAPGEPTVYWAGDTIWTADVAAVLERFKPDVVITHSCGAAWDGILIVMDAAETVTLCRAAPQATVIATHMEALDHATITRADLRAAANEAGLSPERVLIPADGETLTL